MRSVSLLLVLVLAATPAFAQEKSTSSSGEHRGAMFWSGIALGAAGVATAVVGVTTNRVGNTSTGNAPAGTYEACVAQTRDPVYTTNNCDVLKGKNRALSGQASRSPRSAPCSRLAARTRTPSCRPGSFVCFTPSDSERRLSWKGGCDGVSCSPVRGPRVGGPHVIPGDGVGAAHHHRNDRRRIVDSSGAVLPGVTVSLKSPEALGDFTAVTDSNGIYRVTNLPPATYDVRAELTGFQSVIRKAPVRLNAVTEVDFTLSVGAVSETVTVTAESPIVDPERAGLSVNINNQALTSVPVTTSRRFQDAWLVVPGVAVNPATQELTGSERRTSLDGADVTDPYGGDIFAVNLNYDAIQDVEVKALGAEASDGSSMVGQYMNIVTKSGGNVFHGSAALFVIPQRFNDSNVQGIPVNQREDYQPDLTLGGPIVRDRLWFFSAYRRVQTNQTFNNAQLPVQRRGNLWFMKATAQVRNNHRLQVSLQYDRTIQANAIFRGTVGPNRSLGLLTSSTTLDWAARRRKSPRPPRSGHWSKADRWRASTTTGSSARRRSSNWSAAS